MDDSTQVGEFFTLSEFACHDGTSVPDSLVPNVKKLCREILDPIRRIYGKVTIHSGFRTPLYNSESGGSQHSYHMQAMAADFTCESGSPRDWFYSVRELYSGGCHAYYAGFVHADIGPLRDWIGTDGSPEEP